MGVDLCRADITVAKHTLDAANIGAIHEKVGGKAVAHGVRADVFGDASKAGIF